MRQNPVRWKFPRYVVIWRYFVLELVLASSVKLVPLCTHKMVTDAITNSLPSPTHMNRSCLFMFILLLASFVASEARFCALHFSVFRVIRVRIICFSQAGLCSCFFISSFWSICRPILSLRAHYCARRRAIKCTPTKLAFAHHWQKHSPTGTCAWFWSF